MSFIFYEHYPGTFRASSEILDVQNRWSRIQGDRSVGRWAVGSTRNVDIKHSSSNNLLRSSSKNALISSAVGVGGDMKVLGSNIVSADGDLKRPFVKPPLQRQVSYEKGNNFLMMLLLRNIVLFKL